jgi:hypothetical protein
MLQSQASRRAFLSRLLAGSAIAIVGGAAAGCVAPSVGQGGEGPVEVVPTRDGLWYANTMPKSVPPVRLGPAVAPNWSTSKAFE